MPIGGEGGPCWGERRSRRLPLAGGEPLSLHVFGLPPWSHVHLVVLHAFLCGGADSLDHSPQLLWLSYEHLRKAVDEASVLLTRPNHLKLRLEADLDHHSNGPLSSIGRLDDVDVGVLAWEETDRRQGQLLVLG